MSDIGSQIIYKQLLQRHDGIRVPMIQRDYAQGRSTASEVREEFLNAIEEALHKAAADPTLPLNLDFIYGSVDGDGETRFLPLDGQQRLTTLFLLHWYLAWRDGQADTFEQLFRKNGRARFAYSVRPSTTEFFDALVGYRPAASPESVPNLAQLITDQPWYFRSWRLDPTIQSVLCMLDAIHQRFSKSHGLFSRLIDEKQPAITFQLLDLENFGLSDDLYIKMNARGKPLTPFETFKARYEQELQGQFKGETFSIGGDQFSAAEYVARRMDTAWADLFWKLRDPKSHLYDEALMNVFRGIAIVTRSPNSTEYLNHISKLRDVWKPPSYTDFHHCGWLDERFTRALIHLLDSWGTGNGELSRLLPSSRYFDESEFFHKIVSNGAGLAYTEIVQFAAYVMFIGRHHDAIDSAGFQEWMRIAYNLSVNSEYNRPDDLRRSMAGLTQLLDHSDDVLTYFAEVEDPVRGFNESQISEEKLKAELILANAEWKALIDRAEAHPYFRGQVGFLLDFSGAVSARTNLEPKIWTLESHAALRMAFLSQLRLAETMFTAGGLNDLGQYRWQRALLSIGNYLLYRGSRNLCFLVNSVTDEASWKRLLRGTGPNAAEARTILKRLWEQLSPDTPLADQLDAIIEASQPLDPWREALVRCPEAFAYCRNNCIRWYETGAIYLLKRVQMNGAHAELFTYCLYQSLKSQKGLFSVLLCSYEAVMDSFSEPYIELSRQLSGKRLLFRVESQGDQYQIRLERGSCDSVENLTDLLVGIGFSENGEFFKLLSDRSEIEAILTKLDKALQSKFIADHA
jgi:hypothetical protein